MTDETIRPLTALTALTSLALDGIRLTGEGNSFVDLFCVFFCCFFLSLFNLSSYILLADGFLTSSSSSSSSFRLHWCQILDVPSQLLDVPRASSPSRQSLHKGRRKGNRTVCTVRERSSCVLFSSFSSLIILSFLFFFLLSFSFTYSSFFFSTVSIGSTLERLSRPKSIKFSSKPIKPSNVSHSGRFSSHICNSHLSTAPN